MRDIIHTIIHYMHKHVGRQLYQYIRICNVFVEFRIAPLSSNLLYSYISLPEVHTLWLETVSYLYPYCHLAWDVGLEPASLCFSKHLISSCFSSQGYFSIALLNNPLEKLLVVLTWFLFVEILYVEFLYIRDNRAEIKMHSGFMKLSLEKD